MSNLENRVAIVTGAASGIGLACARRYAAEGATVVGIDLQDSDEWQAVVDTIPASRFHRVDVTDGPALQAVAEETAAQLGRIDILLTAAGVGDGGPVNMLEEQAWDRVVDINLSCRSLISTHHLTQVFRVKLLGQFGEVGLCEATRA